MPGSDLGDKLTEKIKNKDKSEIERDHINGLLHRPSIEQEAESNRAKDIINHDAKSINQFDNFRRPQTPSFADEETPSEEITEQPNVYSTKQRMGAKELEALQNSNLYQPGGIAPTKPKLDELRGESRTNPDQGGKSNEPAQPRGKGDRLGSLKNSLNNLGGKAKDKIKKDFTKKAIKQLATKFLMNPAVWPWIIGFVVAAALILFIIGLVINIKNASTSPSAGGKTTAQQVDPISDKEWIQKVLMLSGDKEVVNAMTTEFLEKLNTDLSTLKSEIQDNPQIDSTTKQTSIEKIDALVVKVGEAKNATGDRKKNLALEIKAGLTELAEQFYSISVFPANIPTHLPLDPDKFTRFNNGPHFGTPAYPCNSNPKNNSTCPKPSKGSARTYFQFVQNTCDAVDLSTPENGDPVYSVFPGKITEITSDGVAAKTLFLETTVDGHKYHATYAHVQPSSDITTGKDVAEGVRIGTVKDSKSGHLHFELAIDNRCVVNQPSEKSSTGMGQLLWGKMARVLRLQQ